MIDTEKQKLHSIEANVEEIEQKIRRHRKNIALSIAAAAILTAVLTAAAGIYFAYKEYRTYESVSRTERRDSKATRYESFAGNILRYNNDGAFYMDMSDHLVWNQAFKMQDPFVDVCETYAVIADRQGKQLYIMDTTGIQGEISTNYPIQSAVVARQGTTAVLTQAEGVSYIDLYDKSGGSLAFGGIHVTDKGYPLSIAISGDGKKLAVSILDISKGRAKTTVAFYHFGAAGQNEIDNMVGSYSYDDMVIPELCFVTDDKLIAFGDGRILFFEGRQSPQQTSEIRVEKEIKSIFYEDDYFGLVFGREGGESGHTAEIYDMDGKRKLELAFALPYQSISFLENHEICIRSEYECEIYTLRGIKKFAYKFDDALYQVFSDGWVSRYIFILDGIMEKARLK